MLLFQAIFQQQGAASSLLSVFDLLSGGTLSNFSILAMGVYPYITAQIIIQLLVPIIPSLERRMQENPKEGRKLMEKMDGSAYNSHGRAFSVRPDTAV